jgi:ABC-type phosphate transport system substrate-binding protein
MTLRSLLAFVIVTAMAVPALADPACNLLPSPSPGPSNTIFITGSTALQPIFNVIGPKLASDPTTPYTVVYVNTGSCGGSNLLFTDGVLSVNGVYFPASFSGTGSAPGCTIAAADAIKPDIVFSDVDPTLCPAPSPNPGGINDFTGPVNDMVLVVPSTSTQQAISAEDVYLMFGKNDPSVMPWVDMNYFFIRSNTSGTRAMIAANSMLGSHNWLGMPQAGSSDVFNNVVAQANLDTKEKTIGILGEDFYDAGNNRTSVKALAFRAFKQLKAYWPDSSLTARDRKNVRDGHYKIWGYVHMLAKTSGGTPTNAKAKFIIDLLQQKLTTTAFDIQDTITDAHLTPVCAMHVTHDIEGGDQKPFTNNTPCDCSFEARATGATPAGCTACPSGTCTTGTCRHGWCESK